jgi:hypothetical protein
MSMLPPIFNVLKNSAPVTALIGTNPVRAYRHGYAPQEPATVRPYVTWQLVSGVPANTLSELPSIDQNTIQVDCWSEGDAQVETLAQAVRDAIEPHAHMTGVIIDSRETDTKLYRISLQFDWWQSRPLN